MSELVKEHYKQHLSKFYSWMFGDFDAMIDRQTQLFTKHDIKPTSTKVAIDLGSGSGFQSIALRKLGYEVHAIDTSQELLDELTHKDPQVNVSCHDIRDLSVISHLFPELIVCMGDTLTHLESKEDVLTMIQHAYQQLLPQQGQLILTYRDLSHPKEDLDRFILVKQDAQRILTCVLEDDGENHMKIIDLLHEYDLITSQWKLHKSYYRKIKLSVEWLIENLKNIGFEVESCPLPSGLEVLIGRIKK